MNRKFYYSLRTCLASTAVAIGIGFIGGNSASFADRINNFYRGQLIESETARIAFERRNPGIYTLFKHLELPGVNLADYIIKEFELKR